MCLRNRSQVGCTTGEVASRQGGTIQGRVEPTVCSTCHLNFPARPNSVTAFEHPFCCDAGSPRSGQSALIYWTSKVLQCNWGGVTDRGRSCQKLPAAPSELVCRSPAFASHVSKWTNLGRRPAGGEETGHVIEITALADSTA
jgi:hypothetical protein